ncbi:MAG: glycosyltransferase [Phycisphaerae bacterium]|nr:glycosyltransferase [Phycisphaerae bacterium]
MRTLMVLGNLDVGGAERTALELAVGLRDRGMEVQTAALKGGGPLGLLLRQAGVPLHEGVLLFRFDFTGAPRIARICLREKIDTILLVDIYRNSMFCGLWGARIARMFGRRVRTVLWCSAVPTGQAGDFTPRLRKNFKRGMLDEIVCVSDWQRGMLCEYQLPPEKMATIHNGVDLARFGNISQKTPADLPGPADAPALVQVANVMPDKDYNTLLQAAAILKERNITFRLYLVGRGTNDAPMRNRIDELGLMEQVFPLGSRNDVPAILAVCDVFVLSTRSEVFNIAVLEAMAAGRAVITSDVPGFVEMFDNEKQGLKVAANNPTALANAIQRLLDDEALRNQLAEAAQLHIQTFSREAMCNAFAEHLRK